MVYYRMIVRNNIIDGKIEKNMLNVGDKNVQIRRNEKIAVCFDERFDWLKFLWFDFKTISKGFVSVRREIVGKYNRNIASRPLQQN